MLNVYLSREEAVLAGIVAITLGGFASGCAMEPIRPGVDRVIVSSQPAPRTCKFLGLVTGSNSTLNDAWANDSRLAEGALMDLRNHAYDIGANYVVIEMSRTGSSRPSRQTGFPGTITDTNVGNGYQCPPADIGLI